jgi:hypothetical protein
MPEILDDVFVLQTRTLQNSTLAAFGKDNNYKIIKLSSKYIERTPEEIQSASKPITAPTPPRIDHSIAVIIMR